MCAKQSTVYRGNTPAGQEEGVDVRELISKYTFHWPLFVLVFVVTMAMAGIYFKVKKPGYDVTATLQIQDDSKDKAPNSEKTPLDQIDLINTSKIAENEMEVLRSFTLVSKVVYDLQLWVNYTRTTKLVKKEDLYKRSPISFKLLQKRGDIGGQKFDVVIKNANTFLLKRSNGKYTQFNFSDVLQNNFGLWRLQPNQNINDFIGSTITVTLSNPYSVVDGTQKGLLVALTDKQASTITLTVTDNLPDRGMDELNDLLARYNEAEVQMKNKITQSTLDFINERLKTLTGELANAEGKVQSYSSSMGITDLDDQSKSYIQGTMENDKNLNEVNVELQVINGIERYANTPGSTSVPSTLGVQDNELGALVQKLSEQQIERDRLLATVPEGNPMVDPINKQISATRTAIIENVKNIKASLLAQKAQLEKFNTKYQSTIRGVPTQVKDLMGLKRDQTVKDNLYTYLLQKREELSVSYASILPNARVVDPAYVMPVKPLKKYAPFLVAMAMTFLFPIGLVYGRSTIKNAITHTRDITNGTGVPVLCELSFEKTKTPIVVHDKGKFAIAEEFRTLRTKLHYLHGKTEKGRVTLITSSISSEGKSFISTNLAVAIAASGRKTVILEMDLRKPRVTEVFSMSDKLPGISNYLNGESGVTEAGIIQKSPTYPNLDIIGSGDFYPNPSELLEQDRLATLIAHLREQYDDIVIDTPPVNIVTDAIIIAKQADLTLYAVRQGYTSKMLLPFIK
ncbi:MAG: polysaccharide biosynthesis tyrosine autokinase, partial [Bacteroidetes bacterium]|nr:polysaccharide biosynthesis tyrosine autokinase [Bacteroidota bacterium]